MGKQRRLANLYARQLQTRKRVRKIGYSIAKLHTTSGLSRVKLLRLALTVAMETLNRDHGVRASVLKQFFENVHLPEPTLDQ